MTPPARALRGVDNFRDFGGYATVDGKRVRTGVLYRSGHHGQPTAEDLAALRDLGIRTVVDLRSKRERCHSPSVRPRDWNGTLIEGDETLEALPPELADAPMDLDSPADARATMTRFYSALPFAEGMADLYRRMFAALRAGEVPLVVHCSAGKDRTGIACALVLHAVGVPREVIVRDYLITGDFADRSALAAAIRNHWGGALSAQAADELAGVRRSFVDATFGAIETRSGSVDRYLDTVMNMSADERVELRRRLLEG